MNNIVIVKIQVVKKDNIFLNIISIQFRSFPQ
jgi:hypothetical protein